MLTTKVFQMKLVRPEAHESHDYYKLYINLVSGNDFLQVLKDSLVSTVDFLGKLEDSKWDYRYAEGKWSIKEVMIHIMDAEQIFAYRAIRISRNDQTPLPGFDQDDYVPFYDAENRTPESIISEYTAVRLATIAMFENFNDKMMERMGVASDFPVSVRALAYMLTGHELHHMRVLRERYF